VGRVAQAGAAMTPDLFGTTAEPTSPAVGMMVKLDRDIDRRQPCHDNLAIIRPGKPSHSGELRCVTCNAHRGWLPQTVLNFIIETTRRFGALTEPIIVRQQHKENADMAFQQKPNRGSLFKNDEKSKEEDRDYAGSINIAGREYWLSGWISETKKGNKYGGMPGLRDRAYSPRPFPIRVSFARAVIGRYVIASMWLPLGGGS
jgi:hypothetical protein